MEVSLLVLVKKHQVDFVVLCSMGEEGQHRSINNVQLTQVIPSPTKYGSGKLVLSQKKKKNLKCAKDIVYLI